VLAHGSLSLRSGSGAVARHLHSGPWLGGHVRARASEPVENREAAMREGRRPSWKLGLFFCALASVLMAVGLAVSSAHAQGGPEPGVLNGAFQSEPVTPAKLNIDLSTLLRIEPGPFVPAQQSPDDQGEGDGIPGIESPGSIGGGGSGFGLSRPLLRAAVDPPEEFTAPNPNFNGIAYTALVPPDTNGDVGPSNYIQMVNSRVQIFDKQGASLAGPFNI